MARTLPNLGSVVPDGGDPQPTAALELSGDPTKDFVGDVDDHDHSPGKGALVPTAGLNIDAPLAFNGNAANGIEQADFFGDVIAAALPPRGIGFVGGILTYRDGAGVLQTVDPRLDPITIDPTGGVTIVGGPMTQSDSVCFTATPATAYQRSLQLKVGAKYTSFQVFASDTGFVGSTVALRRRSGAGVASIAVAGSIPDPAALITVPISLTVVATDTYWIEIVAGAGAGVLTVNRVLVL